MDDMQMDVESHFHGSQDGSDGSDDYVEDSLEEAGNTNIVQIHNIVDNIELTWRSIETWIYTDDRHCPYCSKKGLWVESDESSAGCLDLNYICTGCKCIFSLEVVPQDIVNSTYDDSDLDGKMNKKVLRLLERAEEKAATGLWDCSCGTTGIYTPVCYKCGKGEYDLEDERSERIDKRIESNIKKIDG